jgi:hypothetical protein
MQVGIAKRNGSVSLKAKREDLLRHLFQNHKICQTLLLEIGKINEQIKKRLCGQ